jgi:hypothetical protein
VKTETIYVYLLGEGTDVWRPVEAEHLQADLYRIVGAPPEDEVWQFKQGDTVRCKSQPLSGESIKLEDCLVAIEKSN